MSSDRPPPSDGLLVNRDAVRASTAARVTVNLSKRSVAALEDLTRITGETKTEAINKALQLYELVQAAQHDGGGVWIRESKEGELTRARFF